MDNMIWVNQLGLHVDEYEVSVGEFRRFADLNPDYITTADSIGWSGVFDTQKGQWGMREKANWQKQDGHRITPDNHPVTQVSYMDACAYCNWKNGRLPTANEWDILAGKEVIKGNVWEGPFPYQDEGKDGYSKKIAPIGQFQPNAIGIHDLFGNVWEWTSTEKSKDEFIIKGGSFLCDISYCSGYIPSKYQTTARDSGLNHLGFRCVYEDE